MFKERRRQYRTDIEVAPHSFLASRRADFLCFEYRLLDISRYGLKAGVVPAADVGRGHPEDGDAVALHLSLTSDGQMFDQGRIMWTEQDEKNGLRLCGLRLEEEQEKGARPHDYPVALSLDTSDVVIVTTAYDSANILFLNTIERSALIKKEMARLLDDALPCFARSGKAFAALAAGMKEEMRQDADRLSACCETIRNGNGLEEADAEVTGPDALRALMRARLHAALTGVHGCDGEAVPVLARIEEMERQLLENYNTIALLWLGYLAYVYQTA